MVGWFVCCLVDCLQDYSKGSLPILTKLVGSVARGRGKDPFNYVARLDPGTEAGLFNDFLTLGEGEFYIIFLSIDP